jgi:hypothetical protein
MVKNLQIGDLQTNLMCGFVICGQAHHRNVQIVIVELGQKFADLRVAD